MKYYTIYETTNLINGKIYIGQHVTDNPYDDYIGSGVSMRRAIRKYGIENFHKHILFVFDNEYDMDAKEAELVTEQFCSLTSNYNLAPGGNGGGFRYINANGLGGTLGYKYTEEQRKRRSETSIAAWKNEKHRPKLLKLNREKLVKHRMDWTGKKHSEETIQKMKALKKDISGDKNPNFGKCWITNDKENKMIPKIELDNWIMMGYRKGRI